MTMHITRRFSTYESLLVFNNQLVKCIVVCFLFNKMIARIEEKSPLS